MGRLEAILEEIFGVSGNETDILKDRRFVPNALTGSPLRIRKYKLILPRLLAGQTGNLMLLLLLPVDRCRQH